jgi:uncharacterized protein (DUF2141 family)
MTRTIIAAALAACLPLTANAADLTIRLTGAHNDKGSVSAAIYASKEAFPKDGQQVAAFRQQASTGTVSITFHDLPPGRYAVTAFHDENNNLKLDRDATGIPSEGYGVSNDARELASPPYWDKASFELGKEGKTIDIKIEY